MREFSEPGGLSPAELKELARQELARIAERHRRRARRSKPGEEAMQPVESIRGHVFVQRSKPGEEAMQPVESIRGHVFVQRSKPGEEAMQPVESTKNRSTGMAGKIAGPDVTEAAIDALAEVITVPVTSVIMAGVRPLDGAGANAAAGEQIDKVGEALQDIVDPAKIPSALVSKAVTHFLTPLATTAFGPIGPVIAIFAGNFAGELTHQAIDAGLDSVDIQYTESAIDLAGALADASIGRLAESQSFANYVSDLVDKQMAAIINKEVDGAAGYGGEPTTNKTRAITVIVAAYEVDSSPKSTGLARSIDPRTLRVRLASFAVLECIPAGTVVKRQRKGPYEFLLLSDGTTLRRRIDGASPGRWSRISSVSRWLLLGE